MLTATIVSGTKIYEGTTFQLFLYFGKKSIFFGNNCYWKSEILKIKCLPIVLFTQGNNVKLQSFVINGKLQ